MPLNFVESYKKLTFASRNLKERIITKKESIKMAEQKKTNEALNMEEALLTHTQVSAMHIWANTKKPSKLLNVLTAMIKWFLRQ